MQDIFLLPRCIGNKITLSSDSKLKDEFKSKYPSSEDSKEKNDLVYCTTIARYIEGMTDGGDEFKRLFVLYACGCILAPNANHSVDLGLLPVLQDVGKVKQMDWCGFVLNRLDKAVGRYLGNPDASTVSGCILVLLICYLHRYLSFCF